MNNDSAQPVLAAWGHGFERTQKDVFVWLVKHQANFLYASLKKRLHLVAATAAGGQEA